MKAIVNQDSCIGCGLCISTVPEVFEVNADAKRRHPATPPRKTSLLFRKPLTPALCRPFPGMTNLFVYKKANPPVLDGGFAFHSI